MIREKINFNRIICIQRLLCPGEFVENSVCFVKKNAVGVVTSLIYMDQLAWNSAAGIA
jgi:hypothetical protein